MTRPLSGIARGALLWGAGSSLLRDVLQFGSMLALVRLLTPDDYGRAALAQSVLGLTAIFSFKVLGAHALQARDPADIDWQAHFTAAVVVNLAVLMLTLGIAWTLSLSTKYAGAAVPLACLSLVFLVEIPASLRLLMVQAEHDWPRFRSLTMFGTVLGLGVALVIGLLGGGVWALLAPVVLFGAPAALDLIFLKRWRPDWSWSWDRYRASMQFGINRLSSGGLIAGRQTLEQLTLTANYSFEGLGTFTRGLGIATLLAGRIGALVVSALYPVITRAEARSERFSRISGLLFCGIAWTTLPMGVLLSMESDSLIAVLYGSNWAAVTPLLPFAAVYVSVSGLSAAAYSLLLASNSLRACLIIDVISAAMGAALALWLIPKGSTVYLSALGFSAVAVLAMSLGVLIWTGGIQAGSIVVAVAPPLAASLVGVGAILGARALLPDTWHPIVRLGIETLAFGVTVAIVIRIGFPQRSRELIDVAPAARLIRRLLLL